VLNIALFGRNLVVVFGATEFVAPIRLRLFHAEGNRFTGVAYRIAPNPDGARPGPRTPSRRTCAKRRRTSLRSGSSAPGAPPRWRSGMPISRCWCRRRDRRDGPRLPGGGARTGPPPRAGGHECLSVLPSLDRAGDA
jgi:hypothetical protein